MNFLCLYLFFYSSDLFACVWISLVCFWVCFDGVFFDLVIGFSDLIFWWVGLFDLIFESLICRGFWFEFDGMPPMGMFILEFRARERME